MRILPIIGALLTLAYVGPAFVNAQEMRAKLVTAELLADTTAVAPGKPFTVGVRLTVEPGWHVYWKNPGDAGLPIRVTWTLPEGYTAGELQFPVPVKFVQPGDVVGYGYEKEVMLLTTITPPAKVDASAKVAADVKWLVCKDVCIPGKKTLTLDLPVGTDAKPANAELFKRWGGSMPMTDLPQVIDRVTDLTSADDATGRRYDIVWKSAARDVEFFPPASDDVTFSDVRVQDGGRETTLTFKAKAFGDKPVDLSKQAGVLAYVDESGRRLGVVLPLGSQQ